MLVSRTRVIVVKTFYAVVTDPVPETATDVRKEEDRYDKLEELDLLVTYFIR